MDRIAVIVIALGVFLGSIQALTVYTSREELGEVPRFDTRSEELKEGLLTADDYVEVGPPSGDSTFWSRDYTTIQVEASTGILGGEEKLDQPYDLRGTPIPESGAVYVSVEENEVLATFPAEGKRYVYTGYTTSLLTVAQGTASSSVRDALNVMGIVVLDEAGGRLFVMVPAGLSSALGKLVDDGLLASFEEGGWGSGLGKG